MHSLDLFKRRRFTEAKLSDGITYKIPSEFTVEEVERLLELKIQQEEISNRSVSSIKEEEEKQMNLFWDNIFAQIEIIFQSYQPDTTIEYLKKLISHNEALEIVGFFQKYRALAMDTIQDEDLEVKKKLKN